MSIQTALTLGLAMAILVAGFVLRLVVLSVLRVGLRLAGRDTSWLKPQRVPRTSARREPRLRPATRRAAGAIAAGAAALAAATGPALAAAGRSVAAAAAGVLRGAERAGRGLVVALRAGAQAAAAATAALEQWADETNARLAPRTAELGLAARRCAAVVGKRLGSIIVTSIATVQHFASVAAARVRHRLASQRATTGEPRALDARRPRKVIDLDHDDDPPPPARPSRPSRPTAGARL